MNVLIVDDDRFVVASLEKGLNWSALGFHNIYTAYNITAAQTILTENTIHLLLSDIDMPQGSGLDLLTWMRERHNDIPVIFLTNYADFSYAQKAVELQTFHYFLKPIEFDKLEKIIQDATSHMRNTQGLLRQKFENLWQTCLRLNINDWENFLPKYLQQEGLPSRIADTLFLPIIIDIFPYYLTPDSTLKNYFLHNNEALHYLSTTFYATFSDFFSTESVFLEYQLLPPRYLVILPVSEKAISPLLLMTCENYVQLVSSQRHCTMNCFVGLPSLPKQLPQNVSALSAMLANKLDCKNQVLLLSEYSQPSTDFQPLDSKLLDIYLHNRQYTAFLHLCQQYLHRLSACKKLSSVSMTHFQVDFVQVVHIFLKNKEILSNQLFYEDSYHLLSRIARTSLQAMVLYLQYMTNTLENYLEAAFSDASPISSIKNYIDLHFTEDISLTMLSDTFFMNPDYASRLFKKDYGISIKNYIIDKRIEAAKDLLATTTLPINVIATNVGYENYSYFTRLFKKVTNLTPIEFRTQLHPVEKEDSH